MSEEKEFTGKLTLGDTNYEDKAVAIAGPMFETLRQFTSGPVEGLTVACMLLGETLANVDPRNRAAAIRYLSEVLKTVDWVKSVVVLDPEAFGGVLDKDEPKN